jgi:hypothetical protein
MPKKENSAVADTSLSTLLRFSKVYQNSTASMFLRKCWWYKALCPRAIRLPSGLEYTAGPDVRLSHPCTVAVLWTFHIWIGICIRKFLRTANFQICILVICLRDGSGKCRWLEHEGWVTEKPASSLIICPCLEEGWLARLHRCIVTILKDRFYPAFLTAQSLILCKNQCLASCNLFSNHLFSRWEQCVLFGNDWLVLGWQFLQWSGYIM